MSSKIETAAELSVARACGFAGIGIGTFMVGLMTDPALSLQVGGILSLFICMVLVLKASWAPRAPYDRTEVWLMIERGDRPGPAVAQQIIGGVLREVYVRFAFYAAALSFGFLAASVVFRMLPRAI